jgi:hypothetical protein
MDVEIRPIDAAEWRRFCRTMAVGYGSGDDDSEDADLAPHVEYDRTLAAFDGDQIVATAGAFSLQLTLPGLATVRGALGANRPRRVPGLAADRRPRPP